MSHIVKLKPPPIKSQTTEATGFNTQTWALWFNNIWNSVQALIDNANTNDGVRLDTTTVENTTTNTTVYSYEFDADQMHAGQQIEFSLLGAYSNSSASDDWTIRFYVAGALIHTIVRGGGNVSDAGWRAKFVGTIRTAGTSGTFVDYAELIDGNNVISVAETIIHTIDTTVTNTFEVKIQWANAKVGNVLECQQSSLVFRN